MNLRVVRLLGFIIWIFVLVAAGCQPADPPPALERALMAGDWGAIDAQAQALSQDAELRPATAILRGYAALVRNDTKSAVAQFLQVRSGTSGARGLPWAQHLAARHPDRAILHVLAGDALARQGRWQAGMAHLDRAVALDPNLTLARLARASLRAARGDEASARLDLASLPGSAPLAAEAGVVRGLSLLQAGHVDASLDELSRALQAVPDHPVAHNARGVAQALRGKWVEARAEFEVAFRLAPGFKEARDNWKIARDVVEQHGTVLSEQWNLSVFATGINSEADLKYARSHAPAFGSGRQPDFLYVAIQGNLPLAGVERAREEGFATVIVDPHNPQIGMSRIDDFVRLSVASGRDPNVLIDSNKWIPTQLGNTKPEAMDFPARIAVGAQETFRNAVSQIGGTCQSTFDAHSDGTRIATRASTLAAESGSPFSRVVLESPRSEAEVTRAVISAPQTDFTVIQPVRGDFFTEEAQGRFLRFQPGAYGKTIETLKGIDEPNYRLELIETPTASSPILGLPRAHGDPTQYDREFEVSTWQGGCRTGLTSGTLGRLLREPWAGTSLPQLRSQPEARGGISLGAGEVARLGKGRIGFGPARHRKPELCSVYTLFGEVSCALPGIAR